MEQSLDLGGKIASGGGDDTNGHGRGCTDVTRGRGDADQTGHGTGAEPNGGPLVFKSPIEQHPGQATHGGRQVGDHGSFQSAQVGGFW